jgi:hypothetical protein
MKQVFRHGDLCLVKVDKLPDGLMASKSVVLMKGSNGHNHSFRNGVFYPKQVDSFVIGYFKANSGCKLLHPEHGTGKGSMKEASLPIGIYEVRKQNEYVIDELKPVVD